MKGDKRMKKRNTSKRFLTVMLSMAMALGVAGTAWAGNVYGDDGSHIKIMTTAGETTELPKTDFNGAHISLLPADAKIWVSSEGSTANPDTILLWISVCPKGYFTGPDSVTNANFAEEVYHANLEFDNQYPAFSGYDISENVFLAKFQDTDGSWQSFLYLLDDGSYPVIPAEIKTETEAGWKQDSIGWWYQNADGSYPKSAWQQIGDKYYYFNEAGYMLADTTTPDGYQVDVNGAWVQ